MALSTFNEMNIETPVQDWQKIKDIFSQALETDAEERTAFLRAVCGADARLRAEVQSWLDSYAEAENFIETPVFSPGQLFKEDSPSAGKRFGNYQIIREIGRGGMGAVFLSERADGEFEQKVALKIIRQTIIDRETENRFRRERQILALLNHPNIAKLLDGGVSAAGEPFLVMEYVAGKSLIEYADGENLSLKERLELFLKICAAVAFAHRYLIIHRDLKPSNILIDGDGEPKLLDFGLAKILDPENDAAQTVTAYRAFTPSYASPEQLRGAAVSTASDIYSLGIIFYELLTGRRPFDYEGKTLDQIIKTASETEATRPSRIQKSKSKAQSLKGDLDAIISVALRNEPERRYRSVEAFAEDIERQMQGLPVRARLNTFGYRAGKYIRRNRFAAVAVILTFLSLIGGIAVSLWQARAAQFEKTRAEAVSAYLQNILSYSDNSLNLSRPNGRDMTVKDMLNEASERLEAEDLAGQPEVRAELMRIIGVSYLSQGDYALGEKNLRAALDLKTTIYGAEAAETLQTLIAFGELYVATGETASAAKIYQQQLSILRREQQKGKASAAELLAALQNYALLRRAQGDSGEAEMIMREGLELKPQIPPEHRITFGTAQSVFALILSDRGNFDEAVSIVNTTIAEIRQQPNPETPELAANLTALGSFLMEKGELENSLKNLLEAEKIYRKLFNPAFVPLADNLRLQANVFYLQENYAEAENKINEALKIYRESSTPKYINFPTALTVQGLILNRMNRTPEAENLLREAVRLRIESLPRTHFLAAFSNAALGECLATQKRFDEAEPLFRESYESLKNSQGENGQRTLKIRRLLNKLYQEQQKDISINSRETN